MKTDIHPDYFETKVRCACGNETQVYSTVKDMHIDICSNCHPFYTGKQKLIDTAGRIEKFNRKYAKSKTQQSEKATAPEWLPFMLCPHRFFWSFAITGKKKNSLRSFKNT